MDLSLPAHAAAPWLAPALWLVARGTVLLVLAAVAVLALRRGSAAARHMAWALALAGMLVLPVLSLAAPRWELPWVHVVSMDAPAFVAVDVPLGGAARQVPWGAAVLLVWAVGAALTLGRYAVAVLSVQRLAGRAATVTDGPWMERMRQAADVLGMREPVRLLRAEGAAMPMTWGVLRPVVLIPADADAWTAERARVVLLHEMGHVARRDCLWQTVARLACAAYWFHPGVWWAARRMHVEREQACDDQVLAAGTRASDYAGHLLEVARTFRTRPLTAAAAVAMARRSQLEDRVVAVLDAARARGRVPGRVAVLAGGVAAVALFPLAAASPGREKAEPPAEPLAALETAEAHRAPVLEYSVDRAPSAQAGTVSVPLASSGGLHLNVRVPAPPAAAAPGAVDKPYPEPFPELAMDDEATLAALLRASHDADPEVRRSAVWALGRMDGGGVVVGSLVRSMQDSDARVRSAAALALGEYADRQETGRVASGRRPGTGDSLRVPTGSAPSLGRAPTAARTDIIPTKDRALRLPGVMEDDTLSARDPL